MKWEINGEQYTRQEIYDICDMIDADAIFGFHTVKPGDPERLDFRKICPGLGIHTVDGGNEEDQEILRRRLRQRRLPFVKEHGGKLSIDYNCVKKCLEVRDEVNREDNFLHYWEFGRANVMIEEEWREDDPTLKDFVCSIGGKPVAAISPGTRDEMARVFDALDSISDAWDKLLDESDSLASTSFRTLGAQEGEERGIGEAQPRRRGR